MTITARILLVLVLVQPNASFADQAAEERRLNDLAFDRMLQGQLRLMAVADRMRIAGAELCGEKVAPVLGIFAADESTLGDRFMIEPFETFVDRARDRFDLGERPRILVVAPGLPAADAGIKVGDVVASVNAEPAVVRGDLQMPRDVVEEGVIRIGLLRDGEALEVGVAAVPGCTIPSRYQFGTQVNAYATSFGDLTGVYFYDGFLQYFPDDDDLAITVGHEFAHLVRGHTGHLRTSRRYEREADLLGLYFAARAGYDISRAPALWDHLSKRNPYFSVERGFYSHPMSADRALSLKIASDRIARRRDEGAALVPEEARFSLALPDVPADDVGAHQSRQRTAALERFRSDQARIAAVSHRLAIGGTDLCPDDRGLATGLIVGRRRDFGAKRKEQVAAAFGATDEVSVFAVAPDSPADRAGLQVGDRVLAVDGRKIGRTPQFHDRMRHTGESVVARVERGMEEFEVRIPAVEGCAIGALVVPSSEVTTGTYQNRRDMMIPAGLVGFTQDDDELAIAIAHQMAHQIIGEFRSMEREPDADDLGLRIAHQSGFDVSNAPTFWDRWASIQAWTISTQMGSRWIPHGAMALRAPVVRRVAAELAEGRESVASGGRDGTGTPDKPEGEVR